MTASANVVICDGTWTPSSFVSSVSSSSSPSPIHSSSSYNDKRMYRKLSYFPSGSRRPMKLSYSLVLTFPSLLSLSSSSSPSSSSSSCRTLIGWESLGEFYPPSRYYQMTISPFSTMMISTTQISNVNVVDGGIVNASRDDRTIKQIRTFISTIDNQHGHHHRSHHKDDGRGEKVAGSGGSRGRSSSGPNNDACHYGQSLFSTRQWRKGTLYGTS